MNDKFLADFLNKLKSQNSNQVTIQIPEGYEIDKEKTNFDENELCVKFKKKKDPKFRGSETPISGFYISNSSDIFSVNGCESNSEDQNIFFTKKQAKSALAMAQISRIMAYDKRFGGAITDAEWKNEYLKKYVITRYEDQLSVYSCYTRYQFLAFHTKEQEELFLKENVDLVKQYLML
jgi:hypothetical protein